jgi:hypothetical protein
MAVARVAFYELTSSANKSKTANQNLIIQHVSWNSPQLCDRNVDHVARLLINLKFFTAFWQPSIAGKSTAIYA